MFLYEGVVDKRVFNVSIFSILPIVFLVGDSTTHGCIMKHNEYSIYGSSSVSRDMAWRLEGGRFNSGYRPQYGSGLVAEEVPVHFLGYCQCALEQGTEHPMCAPRALT